MPHAAHLAQQIARYPGVGFGIFQSVTPENLDNDQGTLGISTELSAANSRCTTSLRPCASVGMTAGLCSPTYSKDFAALEDQQIAVTQPRNLTEGLASEIFRLPIGEWRRLDATQRW